MAYDLIHLDIPMTTTNRTPLHLACVTFTGISVFQGVSFPNADLVRLLIRSGADVNVADSEGNTAFHVLVRSKKNPPSYYLALYDTAVALVEGGAHIDQRNSYGTTGLEKATNRKVVKILKPLLRRQAISLQCIAATAVMKYRLAYRGVVPQLLNDFIKIH